ncbi:MAG TPA: Crp/Fnr family transcriptional regulator [Puia sp.]
MRLLNTNQPPGASLLGVMELSAGEISLLQPLITHHEFKKGSTLLKEGAVCRSLYLVEKGYLRTWYNKNGHPINLNFTFEKEFAGNIKSAVDRIPSEVNITAGENTAIWLFDLDKFSPEIKAHPTIGKFIRRVTVLMLIASEARSELLKIYTPAERYHYIEQHNPQLLQRISISQLASYLGVTRETISRIRAQKITPLHGL